MSHSNNNETARDQPAEDPLAFRRRLARQFQHPEFRDSYTEDHLNSSIATQLAVLREQRNQMSQVELARRIGTKQPAISRIEDVNYSSWNVKTLARIARALGVRLKISFETFGTLIEEAATFSRKALERPTFEEDPLIRYWTTPQNTAFARLDQEGDPRAWMVHAVSAWLDQADWSEQRTELVNWLRGYGLPPVGQVEEPYTWLLSGLPLGADRPTRQRRFAELVSRLLGEKPDLEFQFEEASDALYNLFLLAAGLEQGELLADPLGQVYQRTAEGKNRLNTKARDGLLAALIRTQIDDRYQSLWSEMLHTGTHPVLITANEYAAFSGMKWMPEGRGSMGKPNRHAIAAGLQMLADGVLSRLGPTERNNELFQLLDQVLWLFNGNDSLLAEIRGEAIHLPRWAKDAIDRRVHPSVLIQDVATGAEVRASVPDPASKRIDYRPDPADPKSEELADKLREMAPQSGGRTVRALKATMEEAATQCEEEVTVKVCCAGAGGWDG